MKYISLLNNYSFNRYFVLKTVGGTYFGDFPIAKSKRRAKEIKEEVKPRNIDLEIIDKLESQLTKSEIYKIFALIYSADRNLKQVKEPERIYIKKLYDAGIYIQDLAKLFHRERHTISKYAKSTKILA